jgi:phosphoribosylformimino-5-aminoimidazole carboxamide ribotide isomerase
MDDNFVIYPAIDLRRGQVVRLMQGDPERQTTYGTDPAMVASRWITEGARWLHVVNLDGAFGEEAAENLAALESIRGQDQKIQIQFGGGLRALGDVERLIDAGVNRVMLGSMAVHNPRLIEVAIQRFGSSSIGLAMDVREGAVHTHGWTQSASVEPIQLGLHLFKVGLRMCAYTDIQRDGGQGGLNLESTRHFAQGTGLTVIASGGVGSLEDVRAARLDGLSGVIIGRALYEGRIDLNEALAC